MKSVITILSIIILFTYCKQNQDTKEFPEKTLSDPTTVQTNKTENQQIHYFDTTFLVNKQNFRFTINDIDEENATLTFIRNSKKIKTDTISSIGLGSFKFIDFNKDGNNDIQFTYLGNNPTFYLYLFDSKNNEFKNVKDFDKFSYSTQLKTNPKYYYSYHRAGCADYNWVSDLFYIDNFTAVHIGHIYGQGCEFEIEENPQVIKIFKITDNNEENKKQIEKLPYAKNITRFEEKWDFIENYWNANYKKFE